MAHQLIKLVSVLFLSFMVIPTIQGQGVSQNDREYWVNTLLKVADPVLSNSGQLPFLHGPVLKLFPERSFQLINL